MSDAWMHRQSIEEQQSMSALEMCKDASRLDGRVGMAIVYQCVALSSQFMATVCQWHDEKKAVRLRVGLELRVAA